MANHFLQSAQIIHLLDDETGQQHDAHELVGSDRHQVLLLHKRLHMSRRTGDGRILCALCGTPVYLVSAPDRQHFFFRHFHEDGSCPSITRGNLTQDQINAIRYQGQRESKRHIRLKILLTESIQADPAFAEPVVEGTWKGREGKEYRRPDVRSRFRDALDIAFEVQLSTTFGSVMAEREVFYRSQAGLLLWIFGEFTVDHPRLMMEVIFANNNRNAFIVNEATLDASRESGSLMLECCWAQPARHKDQIVWTQHRKLLRFDELTLDQADQRAFFVDTDRLEAAILDEIQGPPLSRRFEDFWLAFEYFDGRQRPELQDLDRQWADLVSRFAAHGARLPNGWGDWDFKSLMRVVYLAKFGRAVGWEYTQFWPAAHHVHDAEKRYLWIFIPTLRHYGLLSGLEAMDRKGKWAWKMDAWKRGKEKADPTFKEDHQFDDSLRLIFPELTSYF